MLLLSILLIAKYFSEAKHIPYFLQAATFSEFYLLPGFLLLIDFFETMSESLQSF